MTVSAAARLALVALLAAPACGSRAGGAGAVSIEFWALGREGEVVRSLLPDFERANPDVRVRVQQIPWTAAHEKLLTAFVGDAVPDLAQLGNTWIPEFVAIRALEPLDRLVADSRVVRQADHFAGIWDTNVVDGAVWGIPWYVDTRVLFYRSDLLRRAGVERAPRTWEEWRDAMRRVAPLASGGGYAIYLPTDEWVQPVVLGMQRGATLIRDGRWGAFREPAFAQAFDFYVSIFREGLAPVVGNTQVGNYYQRFADGWFAMYVTGPWNLGEFKRRMPAELDDAWDTAPLPAPSGDRWPGVSLAGGASLAIFRDSPHKEQAWRLVEYLSRAEVQARFYQLLGDMPANRLAWDDPALALDRRAEAFRIQLDHVCPLPKLPESERIMQLLWEVAEEAIRGRMSESAVLARLDADVDRMLEKRRWMLARENR